MVFNACNVTYGKKNTDIIFLDDLIHIYLIHHTRNFIGFFKWIRKLLRGSHFSENPFGKTFVRPIKDHLY